MRKSSKGSKGGSPKLEQAPEGGAEGGTDVKVKAVNEMMERIKHGVVLRPVKGGDTKKPSVMEEKLSQESAMEELKGILETVKKSPSRGSQESVPSPPGKSPVSSELEVILRRRRKQACDSGGDESRDGQISKVSSSDSLNGRHSQSSHSSDSSGKEPEGPTGPGPGQSPREPASPSGRGPGPAVAARRRSDSCQEPQAGSWLDRRSRTSLSEKEVYSEAPVTNGCIVSGEEPEKQKPEKWAPQGNGISHLNPGLTVESDTHVTLSPSLSAVPNPLSGNGNTDAEC